MFIANPLTPKIVLIGAVSVPVIIYYTDHTS
jgi:hypothetical protein